MNDIEMRAKVRGCLEFGLGATAAEVDRLADVVATLEQSSDVAKSAASSLSNGPVPHAPIGCLSVSKECDERMMAVNPLSQVKVGNEGSPRTGENFVSHLLGGMRG